MGRKVGIMSNFTLASGVQFETHHLDETVKDESTGDILHVWQMVTCSDVFFSTREAMPNGGIRSTSVVLTRAQAQYLANTILEQIR